MTSPGLLLHARVRMLGRSLTEVVDALGSVEQERSRMREVPQLARATVAELDKIDSVANEISRLAMADQHDPEALQRATTSIKDHLAAIRLLMNTINRVRTIAPLMQDTEESLKRNFLSEVAARINDLEALREEVRKASTTLEIKNAWRGAKLVFEKSEHVFAEYVELLAGLALRDTGYDGGIPEVADQVIHKRITEWNSLTIPAHRQPEEPTALAQFIHLSFPEWTPWALPLAAVEFSRFELKRNLGLQAVIQAKKGLGFRALDVENCLTDAIATYHMGPAYGWAAINIRFDPGASYAQVCTSTRRLKAILAALRTMDNPPTEVPFGVLADRIELAWNTAVSEIDASAPTPQERADVGKDIDGPEIESWIQELRGSYYPLRLKTSEWRKVDEGANLIRARMIDDTAPEWRIDELRKVLNAAWLVRVEDELDKSTDEGPLKTLTEHVVVLLRKVAKLPSGSSDRRGGSSRIPTSPPLVNGRP